MCLLTGDVFHEMAPMDTFLSTSLVWSKHRVMPLTFLDVLPIGKGSTGYSVHRDFIIMLIRSAEQFDPAIPWN